VYDQLGRLTEERYDATGTANDYIERYGYDLAGNRVQMAKDTDGKGDITDIDRRGDSR
jgi:hypothetical protein